MNTYDLGDLVALTGRFYSDAALTTPADPTDVTLSIRDPDRVITTPAPTRASTGIYTYSWIPTKPGLHEYNWTGTGDVVSADQGPVFVKVGIDPGTELCTLAEVRQAVGINTTGKDDLIESLIAAASSAITHRYQREFTSTGTLTRTFEVTSARVDLAPFDLQSIDTISLYPEDTPLAVTRYNDYDLRPVGATTLGTYTSLLLSGFLVVLNQNVFRYGSANIAITGTWGAPSIHPDVRRGAIITVAGWLDRGVSEYGLPDMMQDGAISQPDRPSTWAIPAAAHRLFQAFERQVYA